MASLTLRKHGMAFYPADAASARLASRLGDEPIVVDYSRARNGEHHRKLMAILGILFDNQSQFVSEDAYRQWVMLQVDEVILFERDGVIHKLSKSISYVALDQDGFEDLYERVCDFAAVKALDMPSVPRRELERLIESGVSA